MFVSAGRRSRSACGHSGVRRSRPLASTTRSAASACSPSSPVARWRERSRTPVTAVRRHWRGGPQRRSPRQTRRSGWAAAADEPVEQRPRAGVSHGVGARPRLPGAEVKDAVVRQPVHQRRIGRRQVGVQAGGGRESASRASTTGECVAPVARPCETRASRGSDRARRASRARSDRPARARPACPAMLPPITTAWPMDFLATRWPPPGAEGAAPAAPGGVGVLSCSCPLRGRRELSRRRSVGWPARGLAERGGARRLPRRVDVVAAEVAVGRGGPR